MGGELWNLPANGRSQYPYMLARITDAVTGELMSLHFTSLRPNGGGKAPVEMPKRLLAGHANEGRCIRLWPDECVTLGIAIAEGIETALSASAEFTPSWVSVGAGNMAAFPVLPGIDAITVFADHTWAGGRERRGGSAGLCLALGRCGTH